MNHEKKEKYGLTHLAIAVNDLERTLQFYQQVFDMEIDYNGYQTVSGIPKETILSRLSFLKPYPFS